MSVAPSHETSAPVLPEHGTSPETVGMARRSRVTRTVAAATLAAVVVGAGVGYSFTILVAAVAVVALFVSFRTDRGLLYVLVLVPFGESLGVGPMTVGRMTALLAVAVLLTKFATGRLRIPSFPPLAWLPAALFVLVVVASGLWADIFSGWVFAMGQVGLALAFFAAYALLIDHPDQVPGLLRAYVLGAVFAAGYGFFQAATGVRAEGLQGDANIYALYQVAALAAVVALMRIHHGYARWLWGLAGFPIVVSVLTSQSRGALLALMATAVVLAALSPYRRVLLPLAALIGALLVTVAPMIDDRYAAERVSADRASGRIDIWFTAWHAFTERPWTGVGAGNFVPESIALLTRTPGVELVKSHLLLGSGIEVHNIYLESLAERGVFGLVTLATLLVGTLAGLVVAARRFPYPAVEALAPMLVAFSVASFFLSVSNSKLLWMLIGLSAALLTLSKPHPTPAAGPPPHPRSVR